MSSTADAAALPSSAIGMRRALTASLGLSLAIQAANVVTGVLLARALGVDDRGALAAVILWPSLLATVGSLGVPEAVTYYAARATSARGPLLGTSLVIALVQSATMIIAGFLVVPLVLDHFGSATVRLALIFLAFVPLNLLTLTLMGFLNGRQHFLAFNALRALVVLLAATLISVLAAVGSLRPSTAAVAYLVANTATFLAAAVLVMKVGELELAVSRRTATSLLSFGLKSQTSGVSSMLNERLDQLVISVVLAPAKLGLYVVAVTLTSLVNLIGSSVAFVAFPALARIRSAPDQLEPARRLIVLTLTMSTLGAVPMVVFAPQLLELFFGASFRPAEGPARILLVAAILLSTGRVIAAVLKALGRPLQAGLADAIALCVTVITLAAFLPLFGLLGAALSSLLAYCVSLGWLISRTARALEVRTVSLLVPHRVGLAGTIEGSGQ